MTVRELIEKLRECDQNAVAMVHDSDDVCDYEADAVTQREMTDYERGFRRKAPWWDEQPIYQPVHVVVIR